MTVESPAPSRDAALFAGLPHTARQHQTLYVYAALLRLLGQASSHFGGAEGANQRFPFLAGYFAQIADSGFDGASFAEAQTRWRKAIDAWEQQSPERLPLSALRRASGLSHDDLTLFSQIGLPDEDPRFGLVMDAMQGDIGERRATPALLAASWQDDGDVDVRQSIHRLRRLGMIDQSPPESAALRVVGVVWDAAWGVTGADWRWARHRPPHALPELGDLVLASEVAARSRKLPALLASGAVSALVVRGPRHNGRGTLAAALAREMGKGVLDLASLDGPGDPRWRTAATLACLLDAVMLTAADPAPSEAFEFPELPASLAPFILTLGTRGGVAGSIAERTITLPLATPDRQARERLWRESLGMGALPLARVRMTSGNIVRAAAVARTAMTLDGNATVEDAAWTAVRGLDRPGLDALAKRVETCPAWSRLAIACETRTELVALVARCRQRERLGDFVGDGLADVGAGVRALFKGPSGTGKTLAARMLAGALGLELYRVDLASVVNKYIGETEKNLEQVFARAEELDVILLLDEGDALLTPRTGVQNANDRYANLETNYLLQRLETYEGILLVTTNAAERIDAAFQRRMDVVIDFGLPDVPERWAIWQLHLPPTHDIEPSLLNSAVQRCALSGGQIRNAVVHASLLAMEDDAALSSAHFVAAVEREYRKLGAVSPLRSRNGLR